MLTFLIANWVGFIQRQRYKYTYLYTIDGSRFYVAADQETREHFGDAIAFAIGTCIYGRTRRALTRSVMAHELKHVDQFRSYGIFFPARYYLETLKHGYYKNKFERAARRAELRPGRLPGRRIE